MPDDTTLSGWHYVYERYFDGKARRQPPDCVVVTFVTDRLADQVELRVRRDARIVSGWRQVAKALRYDVHSIEHRAQFLAAYCVRSVAYQGGIKRGVLGRIVPHYASETRRLNTIHRKYLSEKAEQNHQEQQKEHTYNRLLRFMAMLKRNGSRGVFCLMPLPSKQSLDAKLVETIRSDGMSFFDFRDLSAQTRGHYPDGYHMDEVAADIYSRALADEFSEQFPEVFPAGEFREGEGARSRFDEEM